MHGYKPQHTKRERGNGCSWPDYIRRYAPLYTYLRLLNAMMSRHSRMESSVRTWERERSTFSHASSGTDESIQCFQLHMIGISYLADHLADTSTYIPYGTFSSNKHYYTSFHWLHAHTSFILQHITHV